MVIDELGIDDYDEAMALWGRTEGVGLSTTDNRPSIQRYLSRNPGLSSAAREGGKLVGAVLAGHDGRRGYLHHLAVDPAVRGRGVGRDLVGRSLALLTAEGIDRCHIFIFSGNASGQAFWKAVGWVERDELRIYSKGLGAKA